jgi:hypothetical protein
MFTAARGSHDSFGRRYSGRSKWLVLLTSNIGRRSAEAPAEVEALGREV